MKIYHYLLSLFALSACENKDLPSCRVNIQLLPPEGHSTMPYDGMEVTLTNKQQGTAYTSRCSSTGVASFQVEYGDYTASTHYQASSGLIFSGRLESLLLSPEQEETTVSVNLPLVRSTSNALVIKEIYYGGCLGRSGRFYLADQYVTLYNNSDATIYLDGLCVGVVDPSNSKESPWMKHTNMKRIPVNDLTWQFPGSGKEYPLHPGDETTIATNAVDHTGGEYQHPNSVDLSKVDWVFWNGELENQTEPGITPMNLISNVNPSIWMYAFPVIGPAFMVFSLQETTAEAYINNSANYELRPEANNKVKRYLMIPKEWVIDCVDCIEGSSQVAFKRVPSDLDNGVAYIPDGTYSGKSLVRKKAAVPVDRVIYQDTNNSTQDMEVSEPTLKGK